MDPILNGSSLLVGRSRLSSLAAAVLLVVLGVGWAKYERRAQPLVHDIPVKSGGGFEADGDYPSEPFAGGSHVRHWASWCGSDENTGMIAIGPFAAPRVLRFWICGYPMHDGMEVYAERADTHDRRPLEIQSYAGKRWKIIALKIPGDWFGRPILLVAHDGGKHRDDWVGISEPIEGGANVQLADALAAFSTNALLLGLLWFAAVRRLTLQPNLPAIWIPLLAAAGVALLGYLAFWAYFAGPVVGKIFSAGLVGLAGIDFVRRRDRNDGFGHEALAASKLLVLVGLFYVALLNFFPSNLDYYPLANDRWLKLYYDNFLPHAVGSGLFNGQSLHWPPEGWQVSDRPPLQSGWMLLTWVFGPMLGLDEQAAGGTSGLLFQLIWVFGLYGLLRSLGLPRRRAGAWTALASLCGFFILNSVFTWPKLAAGAFGCGVFGLWIVPKRGLLTSAGIVLGGGLAALALLSHAGVAFSFLAIVPWAAYRAWTNWKPWAKAFLLFLLIMLPWLAFQKFYDPPGNRLLKLHLAGQAEVDPRGTWQTIRDSYAKLTWKQVMAVRESNFRQQIPWDWTWLYDFSPERVQGRRLGEYYLTLRAINWWIFGFLALPIALARWRGKFDWKPQLDLFVGCVVTMVIWCSMLYYPKMAVVHQGSYALPITLFALLTVWFELVSQWIILAVLLLQSESFLTTWAVAGEQVSGPANGVALALAVLALVALALVVSREDSV
jgi:hypothetical protein